MQELIRHFGIDWRLLLAQAVNFGVLLFILWRFAYRPILAMLRERREGIERGLMLTRGAEKRMKEIDALQAARMREAEREALAIVNRAEESAKQQREILLVEAGQKSERIIADAKRMIGEEKAKLREELRSEAQELVRDGVARVLLKLPPAPRDRELIDAAVRAMQK